MRIFITTIISLILLFTSPVSIGKLAVKSHKTYGHIYVIYGQIESNPRVYRKLLTRLNRARRGERVYIIVRDNNGGYMNTAAVLTRHIRASKALVIIEGRGWVASAAAHILFQGDRVKIHHKSRILFHNIRYRGFFGKRVIPSSINRLGARKRATYQASLRWYGLSKTRGMLTSREWRRLLRGKDIIIRGKRLCTPGKSHKILRKSKGGVCILRGSK